ncbi:hypothetical protein IFT74_03490 [Oxalobacteraceae sp. CFBP 8755]|nr:hypothetical protein [Oxalobacteraceae sp. CFBP 8761]MBD8630422.1 hypothetical protein [Oxalobacteraceae sp. CFBP 8755]MBD8724242.1 hypothetical protein [Oxalobacteraceae sp. CFBP 13708]
MRHAKPLSRKMKHAGIFWPIQEKIMGRTPNDDRSDNLNPNNNAYDASQDNRSEQLNPNNERYQGDQDTDSEVNDD